VGPLSRFYAVACLISGGAGNGAQGGSQQQLDCRRHRAATRAAAVKEVADAAAVKKPMDDAVAVKMATEEVAKKKAVDEAVVKKATEEAATKKKAAEEAIEKKGIEEAVKKAVDGAAAAKKAAVDVATASSGPCPFPSIGVKRVAAPSASTPPAKRRFLSFWKHQYATQSFIHHFLYRIYDFNLVSPVYSMPSSGRSRASGGPALWVQPKLLGPRTPSKLN
jgi:hypothetical protein